MWTGTSEWVRCLPLSPQWGHMSEESYSQQRGRPGLPLASGDIYSWKPFPLLFPLLFPVRPGLLHKAAHVGHGRALKGSRLHSVMRLSTQRLMYALVLSPWHFRSYTMPSFFENLRILP